MADIKKELNDIKNAVYGREVRGSIHDGIKKINDEVEISTDLSESAKHQVENIQQQVNQLVVEGDSSVEAAQARVDVNNHAYDTLKQRLDTEYTEVTSQLAQTDYLLNQTIVHTSGWINVKSFGAVGDGVTDDSDAIQEAINSVGYYGGVVYFPNGVYKLTKTINLLNDNISQPNQLELIGESRKGVRFLFSENVPIGLNYDNGSTIDESQPTKHSLRIQNILIATEKEVTQYEDWHTGIGLNLAGLRNSSLEYVNVSGFESGIILIRGYLNEFKNVYVNRCKKAFRVEGDGYVNLFERVTLFRCGSFVGGENYGLYIKNGGGVILNNCTFEIQRGSSSLIFDGVKGFTVNGINVENSEQNPAISLRCTSDNIEDERNWTSGGVINGGRFWKSRGVSIQEGVKDISIIGLSFLTDDTWDPDDTTACIYSGSSVDKSKIRNVDYSNCSYYPNPATHPILHKSGSSSLGVPFRSFTENGKRYANASPSAYDVPMNLETGSIVYNATPEVGKYVGWVCTDGELNTWRGFGLID